MYQRRSEAEIQSIRIKLGRRARRPWLLVVISALFAVLFSAFMFVRGNYVYKPLEADADYLVRLGAVIFLVTLAFLYFFQIRRGRNLFEDMDQVCPVCRQADFSESAVCDCGSPLEPMEFYTEESDDTA